MFMRQITKSLGVVALLVELPAPLAAQTTAPTAASPAKPVSTCEGLARDWRSIEYDLANNYAAGVTDDSAPRATMRAAQNAEALARAQITLALMRDNKCSIPKRAPSQMTYALGAMKCRTEMMKSNYKAPECDRSTWTPLFSEGAEAVTK
jgi:hypothetical protein